MNIEMIEKFIDTKSKNGVPVNIHFKERSTINGLFIVTKDYDELKAKNFWRIVSKANIDEWKKTQSNDLVRIYNGMSFTKLSDSK